MAYDRYETRDYPRDERSRWRDEGSGNRDWDRSGREDRGFFERAGDEIASWFGDDDAERRRREDLRMQGRDRGFRDRGWERGEGRGYSAGDRDYNAALRNRYGRERDRDRGRFERDESGSFGRSSYRGYGGGGNRASMWGTEGYAERGFQPLSGEFGHIESDYDRSDYTSAGERYGRYEAERGQSRRFDPHYHSWRQRQMDELDRDYEDYRRENQSRFESDFGSWRERRIHKRSMLGQIREHMEVVGSDDQHVGTVDRVAGDRIILTRSDPESGGAHHSLSCADIDRVEGDRAILDCSADQAKQRWRDESRGRALFEREDQGEMGDRALNRSFEGTYRE